MDKTEIVSEHDPPADPFAGLKVLAGLVGALAMFATATGLVWTIAYYRLVGFSPNLSGDAAKNLVLVVFMAALFGVGKYIMVAVTPGLVAASLHSRRVYELPWVMDQQDRTALWAPFFGIITAAGFIAASTFLSVPVIAITASFLGLGVATVVMYYRVAPTGPKKISLAIACAAASFLWNLAALTLLIGSEWALNSHLSAFQVALYQLVELALLSVISLLAIRCGASDLVAAVVGTFVLFTFLNPGKLAVPFEEIGLARVRASIAGSHVDQAATACGWPRAKKTAYDVTIADAVGTEYIVECDKQFVRLSKNWITFVNFTPTR